MHIRISQRRIPACFDNRDAVRPAMLAPQTKAHRALVCRASIVCVRVACRKDTAAPMACVVKVSELQFSKNYEKKNA